MLWVYEYAYVCIINLGRYMYIVRYKQICVYSVDICIYMYVYIYMCVCVYIFVCIRICSWICMYVYVFMYVCTRRCL